ncbi:MAG: methyltransferase domain-containing protein [Rhodoplanes sp.]|uniref:rhodoquinone biosynthesis methyltransferase RquA n=1 Tax=Rhodoplanes sp. TaxID=1968906 RepID=UPI00185E17AC|nr:rhodoquinone biosynthesis methyltransferase RquA [Rhodoplanes sp.]NVO13247.1 methyltransferase domain-containing protein [Rhodoplanes sp.]
MQTVAVRTSTSVRTEAGSPVDSAKAPIVSIPQYLEKHYWWAYIHPNAIRFFDHQPIINFILWGNYAKLRNAALAEMGDELPGQTLQVACAYGDLTPHLCERVSAGGGRLDVIDIVPAQLRNVRRKLKSDSPVRLLNMDSADLNLPDASYDRAIVYLLFHEQPVEHRERTLAEIFRVVKPGGKVVIVDYAKPDWWHPWRYWFKPVLAVLEPFALDLWNNALQTWMPAPWSKKQWPRQSYFGGLYQKIVVTR